MKLPLIDILPRLRRTISNPDALRPAVGAAALVGGVEGLALAALLPAISSLASGAPVWGWARPAGCGCSRRWRWSASG